MKLQQRQQVQQGAPHITHTLGAIWDEALIADLAAAEKDDKTKAVKCTHLHKWVRWVYSGACRPQQGSSCSHATPKERR